MASSQEIAAEIAKLEKDLLPLEQKMDEKIAEFAAAIPKPASEWIFNHVRSSVQQNADKVTKGGVENLRPLKSEVGDLIAALPDLAKKFTSVPGEWPHRHPELKRLTYVGTKHPYFENVYRKLVSSVGPILAKHGLIKVDPGRDGEWKRMANVYEYGYSVYFDGKEYSAVVQYIALLEKYVERLRATDMKRREMLSAQAGEMWDKA